MKYVRVMICLGSLLLMAGCCTSIAIRQAAPMLEVSAPVEAPVVKVPTPNNMGYYCFSPEELQSLAKGIKELKEDNKKLRAVIDLYNSWKNSK